MATTESTAVDEVMNPLEIAADVAQALGLLEHRGLVEPIGTWLRPDGDEVLWKDGSNLTDDWVFKRCCEWLVEHNYRDWSWTLKGAVIANFNIYLCVRLECPFTLAPAALVSAVWRKRAEYWKAVAQEKQNG